MAFITCDLQEEKHFQVPTDLNALVAEIGYCEPIGFRSPTTMLKIPAS